MVSEFLFALKTIFIIINISSLISSQEETRMCIGVGFLCSVKCCPSGQIWNSIVADCRPSETAFLTLESEKQVWKENSPLSCPEGKKPFHVSPNITQTIRSAVQCIEDVAFDKQHKDIDRRAFICVDQHSNATKENILLVPINETAQYGKPTLLKCCNESGEFYSIVNRTCQSQDEIHQWPPNVIGKETNKSITLSDHHFQLLHGFPECGNGSVNEATTDFHLYDDGTMATVRFSGKEVFQAGKFCIENLVGQERVGQRNFSVRFCVPDLCLIKPCIRKCCPMGYAMNSVTESCEIYNELFLPSIYNETKEISQMKQEDYFIRAGIFPDCSNGINNLDPQSFPEDLFNVQASGNLYIPAYKANFRVVSEYCIDQFFTNNSTSIKGLICFPPTPTDSKDTEVVLAVFPYFLFLSSVFLIATLIVYSMLPELRNLHGITIMCYVSSLTMTYICFGIIQINKGLSRKEGCVAFAVIAHFCFLASFTWLSVLSFDIWYTFCDVRARNNRVHPKNAACSRRFIIYSIYAWGLPLIIVTIGQIVDHLPNLPASIITPNFGTLKCWFHENDAMLAYLYGPIAVLLAIDLVFYILTAVRLYVISRDSAVATHNRNTKQKIRVIFSLFILMGISWVTEIISFASGGLTYIWIPTDIFNILTGFFIFVIFVCKKKVWKLFRKRCRSLRKYCFCCRERSADWDTAADKSTSPVSKSHTNTSREDDKSKVTSTALTNLGTRDFSPEQDSGQDIQEEV